jgi:hypothetical protein
MLLQARNLLGESFGSGAWGRKDGEKVDDAHEQAIKAQWSMLNTNTLARCQDARVLPAPTSAQPIGQRQINCLGRAGLSLET